MEAQFPSNQSTYYTNRPIPNHDRREGAAVDRGTFHQRANGVQVLLGPICFHGVTLQCKVNFGKYKTGARR